MKFIKWIYLCLESIICAQLDLLNAYKMAGPASNIEVNMETPKIILPKTGWIMYKVLEVQVNKNINSYYTFTLGWKGTFLGNEHWIGLNNIYKLTNDPYALMKLRITMEDFSGTVKEAIYNSFRIEDGVSSLKSFIVFL